ncbi:hypothetical protein KIN20_036711 [Parelaphostrongylus tenuis]|uniref:Uncharacterized protein n=1 Tax=Parelaphostrongylus tenuis TaxID=148309 RepID=A0AAD5WLV9_PARTN|nr:hypothetical protein KIN20_036711 [Parelaphostrongylus tenuis]
MSGLYHQKDPESISLLSPILEHKVLLQHFPCENSDTVDRVGIQSDILFCRWTSAQHATSTGIKHSRLQKPSARTL